MKKESKGYYIYSTFTVLFFVALMALIIYFIYDLILKLSLEDFTNNTVIQALITLIITVFIGGYFSKWLEIRNAKKLELYEIRNKIAITVIDLSTAFIYKPNDETTKYLLIAESSKIKLYFDDEILKIVNELIESNNKLSSYKLLVEELKKAVQ